MCAVKFEKPRLILCEGTTDKAFFCELIRAKRLPDFQVNFPYDAKETSSGVTKFGRFLEGAKVVDFQQIVQGLLLVADRDDNSARQFDLVCDQLRDEGFGVPARELEFVRSPQGLPPVAIMMLPLNQQEGNLETVLRPVALDHWNTLADPLDNYFQASEAVRWNLGRQDKMKIQCLIAATCEPNPCGSISTIYMQNARYHLPLNSPHLDDVAAVLANFDASVSAAV